MRMTRGTALLILLSAATAGAAISGPGVAGAAVAWTTYTAQGNGASLASVDSLAAGDVWAVGLRLGGQCQYQTLAEHWNGTTWTVSPSVDVPGRGTVLADVAAVGHGDVWAVGTTSCPTVQPTRTLAEHWDGSAWTIVPTPNPSTEFSSLAGVTAVSATNLWAVGSRIESGVGSPLVEHWNGTAWRVVASPRATQADELVAISASGTGDVWAVGSGPSGGSDQPLAMHWNGRRWRFVPVPTTGGAHGFLSDVTSISPTDAWAVGGQRTGGGATLEPLIVHWDGSAWAVMAGPDLGSFAALDTVDHTPAGRLWAGGFSVDLVRSRAVVLTKVPTGDWMTVPPPPTDDLFDMTVSAGAVWGVSGSTLVRGQPG
jgi:hypothetical protein